MEVANVDIVLYEDGVPVVTDHDFVKGLKSLLDATWFLPSQSPVEHYTELCKTLKEGYQFDVRCLGVLDKTNIVHFRTGYEFGSVKYGWVQEILDYLKPLGSSVHLHHYDESCSDFLSEHGHDEQCICTLKMQMAMERDLKVTLLSTRGNKLKQNDEGYKVIADTLRKTLERLAEEDKYEITRTRGEENDE